MMGEDVHREYASHKHLTIQHLWKEYKASTPEGLSYNHNSR